MTFQSLFETVDLSQDLTFGLFSPKNCIHILTIVQYTYSTALYLITMKVNITINNNSPEIKFINVLELDHIILPWNCPTALL